MRYTTLINLAIVFGFIHGAKGLGINCRGSGFCFLTTDSDLLEQFQSAILYGNSSVVTGGPMADNEMFFLALPQSIACSEHYGVCLFLQGNVPFDGVSGATIKARISDLIYHGCNICGSVPLSGDNNPDEMGILTSNIAITDSCSGVCAGFAPPTS